MVWSFNTLCWTSQGIIPIQDLVDKEPKLWNGKKWVKVKIELVGLFPLISVTFSNGVRISGGHGMKVGGKYALLQNRSDNGLEESFPSLAIPGTGEMDSPYLHGVYLSSMIGHDGKILNPLVGDKMVKILSHPDMIRTDETVEFPKFETAEVPLNLNQQDKIQWLNGLFDSRGFWSSYGLTFSTTIERLAFSIQQMLLSLPVRAILESRVSSHTIFPYREEKVREERVLNISTEVTIPWSELPFLRKLGFQFEEPEISQQNSPTTIGIASVIDHGLMGPVYRITGSDSYVLNGVLVEYS